MFLQRIILFFVYTTCQEVLYHGRHCFLHKCALGELNSSLFDVACLLPWEQWTYWTTCYSHVDSTEEKRNAKSGQAKTKPAQPLGILVLLIAKTDYILSKSTGYITAQTCHIEFKQQPSLFWPLLADNNYQWLYHGSNCLNIRIFRSYTRT